MMRRTLAFAVLLATLGVVVSSGQVRDRVPAVTSTGVITGTVVTDDQPPRPLGRAIVTVKAAELPVPLTAITDDRGRFAVRNLPAGRFTITAAKQGYVAGAYGARRIGRPGTPVMLAAGQSFDATIATTPAGVATGTIRDARGQPLSGVRVFAVDAQKLEAPRQMPTGGAEGSPGVGVDTDDRGVYRLFNLVPGEYLIVATPTSSVSGDILRPSTIEIDRLLAQLQSKPSSGGAAPPPTPATPAAAMPFRASAETFAVVYYPGTPVMADAAPIAVGRGEVHDALDFIVQPVPVTTIEGAVIGPAGALPSRVEMSIVPASALRFFALASANPQLTRRPDATGGFTYSTIVPGHYTIVARAGSLPEPGIGPGGMTAAGVPAGVMTDMTTLYGSEEIDVTGQPVTGVTVRLQRGSTFSGRVVFDAATQPVPADLTGIRITIQPADRPSSSVAGTIIGSRLSTQQYMTLRADGTFEFPGLAPDTYRILCPMPSTGGSAWWFRSATAGGRDALDTGLVLTPGVDVKGAVLTFTDRHSELGGTLQTPAGAPASDYFVAAMPAEESLRVPRSRRIVSTRPGTDGRFTFADLPAGNYLLVALNDLLPGDLLRAEFLAEIASAGVPVTLGTGEKKTQDLRIAR